jgi:hypothetical protein
MKLTKSFRGVPDGEIYPKLFEAGEECPPELEAAAIALGAADEPARADDPAPAKPARAKKQP